MKYADQTLTDHVFEGLDLNGADFRRAVLVRCRFIRCDMRKGKFNGATLTDCEFEGCDLRRLDLAVATVTGGNLVMHDGRFFGRDFLYLLTPEGAWAGCSFEHWGSIRRIGPTRLLKMGGRHAMEAAKRNRDKLVEIAVSKGWLSVSSSSS
jgi:hypothetical protein